MSALGKINGDNLGDSTRKILEGQQAWKQVEELNKSLNRKRSDVSPENVGSHYGNKMNLIIGGKEEKLEPLTPRINIDEEPELIRLTKRISALQEQYKDNPEKLMVIQHMSQEMAKEGMTPELVDRLEAALGLEPEKKFEIEEFRKVASLLPVGLTFEKGAITHIGNAYKFSKPIECAIPADDGSQVTIQSVKVKEVAIKDGKVEYILENGEKAEERPIYIEGYKKIQKNPEARKQVFLHINRYINIGKEVPVVFYANSTDQRGFVKGVARSIGYFGTEIYVKEGNKERKFFADINSDTGMNFPLPL